MNSEFLLEAIGLIDDELISDAERRTAKTVIPLAKILSWAACLAVVIVLGYGVTHLRMGGAGNSAAPAASAPAASTPAASTPAAGAPSGEAPAAPEPAAPAASAPSGNEHEQWGDGSPSMKDEQLLVTVPIDGKVCTFVHDYGEDRTVDVLPEGCRHIGKVETWSETSTAPYTDYDVYLGCELWLLDEGEHQTLYLELPEGGYLECK